MLRITIERESKDAPVTVTMPEEYGPALRSALDDLRNQLGERLCGLHPFPREAALTRASVAVSQLSAGIAKAVPHEETHYHG